MNNTLIIIQIVVSVLLVVAVLIQNKGAGLSQAFGGSSDAVYHAKRGSEKTIFYITIALAVIFVGLSIANIFV